MKKIKYQYLSCEVNIGTEEAPLMKQILVEKVMPWTEETEAIAKREALNGVYEIYDDGQPEPEENAGAQETVTWDELAAALKEGVDQV